MKLKCDEHNRRVMVLNNAKTLHRNDGSECKSQHVSMGGAMFLPSAITRWVHKQEPIESDWDRHVRNMTERFEKGINLTRDCHRDESHCGYHM
jgi:hypothetical protein